MSVSVVIPVRNGEKYIAAAIESVAYQGNAVKDVVVVDDGSTDRTREIVCSLNPRITLLSTGGVGVSEARNRGARAAKGDWLHFLDADDRLRPAGISALLSQQQPEADVVYGDFDRIDEFGKRVGFRGLFDSRNKPSGYVLEDMMKSYFLGNGGTAIVRAEAFARTGGFDNSLAFCEDWHLACRLAALSTFKYVSGLCVLDYRFHCESTMSGSERTYRDFWPAVERVYSDRLIVEKIPRAKLARLRAQAESHLLAYSGTLAVRGHQYLRASAYGASAIRRAPLKTPKIISRILLAHVWV